MRKIWLFVTGAGGWAMGSNFASFVFYIIGLITLKASNKTAFF
jgi:hypothetical protein